MKNITQGKQLPNLSKSQTVMAVSESVSLVFSFRPETRPKIIRGITIESMKTINHINYSLPFFSGFFEVHSMPSIKHTAETMIPVNISINCGSSPRNMPPKIKLANEQRAESKGERTDVVGEQRLMNTDPQPRPKVEGSPLDQIVTEYSAWYSNTSSASASVTQM